MSSNSEKFNDKLDNDRWILISISFLLLFMSLFLASFVTESVEPEIMSGWHQNVQ